MEMHYEVDSEKSVPISSVLLNGSRQQVKKEFRFRWIIENVSICTQKRWEAVESPKFAVEDKVGTKWLLKLYPKGRSDEKNMACYLERETSTQQTSNYTNFTLSYLKKDGTLKEVEVFLEEESGSIHCGTDSFKPIEDMGNKLIDCKENILTIFCHMWSYQSTKSHIIQCSAHTLIKIERISFAWDLLGVKKKTSQRVPPVMESKLKIPMISTNLASSFEIELAFECTTNKIGCYERTGCIYLLATGTKERPISTHLKITTKSMDSHSEYGHYVFEPSTSEQKWFFSNVPGNEFIKRRWFSDDYKLNLICELIVSGGEELKQIEEIRYGLPFVEERNQRLKTNFQTFLGFKNLPNLSTIDKNFFVQNPTSSEGARSDTDSSHQNHLKTTSNKSTITDDMAMIITKSPLKEDLFLFYSNKTLCDAYLLADEDKIHAHKVVLAARSPVLHEIIKESVKDSVTEIVDISNSNPATLWNFIKYLYSEEVEDLHAGSALQMYFCATKYKVSDLQAKCFQFLKTTSGLVDICDFLSVDGIQDEKVKDLALKFFATNAKEIFSSEEWEKTAKEKPLNALKVTTLVCMNLSQNSS